MLDICSFSQEISINGMKIIFENVNEENLEVLKSLDKKLFPIKYQESFYTDIIKDPERVALIFKMSEIYIAVSTFHINSSFDCSYLMTLGVLPEYRDKKIGSSCLIFSEDLMKRKYGVKKIYLHVQTNNLGAKYFYEKHGYKIIRTEQEYYKTITPKSAYFLEKELL